MTIIKYNCYYLISCNKNLKSGHFNMFHLYNGYLYIMDINK